MAMLSTVVIGIGVNFLANLVRSMATASLPLPFPLPYPFPSPFNGCPGYDPRKFFWTLQIK